MKTTIAVAALTSTLASAAFIEQIAPSELPSDVALERLGLSASDRDLLS